MTLSETLVSGPTVVLVDGGAWWSFCAEQLRTFSEVAYDLRSTDGVDVLPVVTDDVPALVDMRDRFAPEVQLLADPDGDVAEQYSGTEGTSHGVAGVAATYVVDTDGVGRDGRVADHPADRTYGDGVRYFIRNDHEDVFA